ncbi:hypothetical protein AFI02nite_42590 [Aliivibrio fischeri]|uniref:Uncharacterized protein n=1 Tax=Aliivibrio fischeri TaxID=668 RepID=A0A510UNJ2_ALIFS|nr:hypothetical protein AFI02nite_42590 [Aliivibrio fischeri]
MSPTNSNVGYTLYKINSDGLETVNTYGINVGKEREVIRFPDVTDYPKSNG